MESEEPLEVQDPEEEQGERVGDGQVSQVRFTGWDLPKRHINPHLYESSPGEILTTGGRGGLDGPRQQSRRPPRVPPASRGTVNSVISSLLHTRWVSHVNDQGWGVGGGGQTCLIDWFSASVDGPPEPCWYCLRTQESGTRPETGQQVFS